jgi:hypothetical protein
VSELFVSRLRASEKLTATAAVSVSTLRGYPSKVRVISDRIIHVATGISPTATQNDVYVYANEPFFVSVGADEQIAVVKNTGETDGSVWFTYMDISQ